MGKSRPIKVEVTNIENQQDQRGRFIYNCVFGDKSDDDRTVKNKGNKQTDSLTMMTT